MTAKDMQLDVRMKLNKLDSQKYRELQVQEVDWKLYEAELLIIKKYYDSMQFDRIMEVVVTEEQLFPSPAIVENICRFKLPLDFLHYISGHVLIFKNNCYKIVDVESSAEILALPKPETITVRADLIPKSFVDIHVDSVLDSSSFEWRQVNFNFAGNDMLLYIDDSFSVVRPHITYIRKPARIVSLPSYQLPGGEILTYKDCELHESLHNEIVDLAVLIASTDLQMKDIQSKENKVKLN